MQQLTWICGRQPWGVSNGQYQWCSFSWPLHSSCLQNKRIDHITNFASKFFNLQTPYPQTLITKTFFLTAYYSNKPHSLFRTQSEEISGKYGIHTLSLALLRVSALATWGLLEMVSLGPTTTAQGVRLVPALTKRWRSLGLMRQTEKVNIVQKAAQCSLKSCCLVSAQKNESQ